MESESVSKGLPHRVGYYLSLHGSIEIHDSETHWTSTADIANEIHDPIMIFISYLTRVETHKGVDECLGLDLILACLLLLNFTHH